MFTSTELYNINTIHLKRNIFFLSRLLPLNQPVLSIPKVQKANAAKALQIPKSPAVKTTPKAKQSLNKSHLQEILSKSSGKKSSLQDFLSSL